MADPSTEASRAASLRAAQSRATRAAGGAAKNRVPGSDESTLARSAVKSLQRGRQARSTERQAGKAQDPETAQALQQQAADLRRAQQGERSDTGAAAGRIAGKWTGRAVGATAAIASLGLGTAAVPLFSALGRFLGGLAGRILASKIVKWACCSCCLFIFLSMIGLLLLPILIIPLWISYVCENVPLIRHIHPLCKL